MTQRAAELIKTLECHPFQPGKSITDYTMMISYWTGKTPIFGNMSCKGVEEIARAVYNSYSRFPELITVIDMFYSVPGMKIRNREKIKELMNNSEFRNRYIASPILYDLKYAQKVHDIELEKYSRSLEKSRIWKKSSAEERAKILNHKYIEQHIKELASKAVMNNSYSISRSSSVLAFYCSSKKAIGWNAICENMLLFNTFSDCTNKENFNEITKNIKLIYCIMMHEIGHAMEKLLQLDKYDELKAIYKRNYKSLPKLVSDYSQKNFYEFIAEVWAEYKGSESPRWLSCEVGEIIEDIYAKKCIENDYQTECSYFTDINTSTDDGFALFDVPVKFITEDMCLKSVQRNGMCLAFVPEQHKTLEICIEAVRNVFLSVRYVPERIRTPEFFSKTGINGVCFLQFAPEKILNSDICRKIVIDERNFSAFKYIPDKYMTSDMCNLAVAAQPDNFAYVPVRFMTPKMCVDAVKNNGDMLKRIPDRMKTPEMCLEAVRNAPRVFSYVPENMLTEEICIKAVKRDNSSLIKRGMPSLDFIPKNMRTEYVCKIAVKHDERCLKYVPDELKTYDICLDYIQSCARLYILNNSIKPEWNLIPNEFRCNDFYFTAVKKGISLRDIPINERNERICLEAINISGSSEIKYIPEEMKNCEFYMKAVRRNGSVLKYIPVKMITYDMCMTAVSEFALSILFVPLEILDIDICRRAVAVNGKVLQFIPHDMIDEDLCFEAVHQSWVNLQYVPPEKATLEIYAEAYHQNPEATLFYIKNSNCS